MSVIRLRPSDGWSATNRARLSLFGIAAAALILGVVQPTLAVMVGTTPNAPPNTSNSPAVTAGWTQGDPGWNNAAKTYPFFYNGVYIGDGWILTAEHTYMSSATFTQGGQGYNVIPNPADQNNPYQSYRVPNPSGVPGLTAQYADLRMYRIDADPGLPSLTIATVPLAVGDEVMFISDGQARAAAETHWYVDTTQNPDRWQTTFCSGCQSRFGYQPGSAGKRWGTNIIEDDQTVFGSSENDADITYNINGATIANMTLFNRFSSNPFEAQVVSGDSGSAVYHKRGGPNGVWELAGITTDIFAHEGQDPINAVYDDASLFADLYSYSSQIAAIKAAHIDYSVAGDVNLDGVGGTAADITAFVNGWGSNSGTGQGTITSWKLGDLTHDGKTNVADFLKFRSGLTAGAGATLDAMMGNLISGGVPEPSAMFLAIGSAIFFALFGRNRRSRFGTV